MKTQSVFHKTPLTSPTGFFRGPGCTSCYLEVTSCCLGATFCHIGVASCRPRRSFVAFIHQLCLSSATKSLMEDSGNAESRRQRLAASPRSQRIYAQVEFAKLKMMAFDLHTGAALIDVIFTSCCPFQSAQFVFPRAGRVLLSDIYCFIIIFFLFLHFFHLFELKTRSCLFFTKKPRFHPRRLNEHIIAQLCRVAAFSKSIAPSDPDPIMVHWSSQQ